MTQKLKILGVEGETLILASEQGEQFELPVDDALHQAVRRRPLPEHERRLSPREIQTMIRSGLTVQQISSQSGVSEDTILKFAEPVFDELAYMIDQAQQIPMRIPGPEETDERITFGVFVRKRLAQRDATDLRWSSWRQQDGQWIIQAEFLTDGVARDARWFYDHKHKHLEALNQDAKSIAQDIQFKPQRLTGSPVASFLFSAPEPLEPQDARVEDGAQHGAAPVEVRAVETDPAPAAEPTADTGMIASVTALPKRAPRGSRRPAITEEMLDELNRKRGQREPMPVDADEDDPFDGVVPSFPVAPSFEADTGPNLTDPPASEPEGQPDPEDTFVPVPSLARDEDGSNGLALLTAAFGQDGDEHAYEEDEGARDAAAPPDAEGPGHARQQEPEQANPQRPAAQGPAAQPNRATRRASKPKKGRASMPSWDEIMFGSRHDDQ